MHRREFRFFERLRVRWAEVDLQKIVFNGHYLMYFDTAVAGYWRSMALPYETTMAALQGDLYVRKSTVEYQASAEYDDVLDIGLRCDRVGNSSIRFVASVFRGSEFLVSGELIYVFADPHQKVAQAVPQALRDAFMAFEAGQAMVEFTTEGSSREAPGDKLANPSSPGAPILRKTRATNRLGAVVAEACWQVAGGQKGAAAEAQLLDLAVTPALQRSGLGRQLVSEVSALARQAGCRTLIARAPLDLVRSFQAFGFEAAETVRPTAESDAVELRLNLAIEAPPGALSPDVC